MADFTILRRRRHRVRDGYIIEGSCTWPTTATSATLPILETGKVKRAVLVPAQALTAPTLTAQERFPLSASVSATSVFTFRMPRTGTVTAVSLDTSATISASDSTYWSFGILNKTATTTLVTIATAANTTQLTGGLGTTAYTAFALTLTTAAVTANDLYELTITKTSTPNALTALSLNVTYTYAGQQDEQWFPPTVGSGGYYTLSSGKLTFTRAGSSPTSAAKGQFYVEIGN